MLIWNHARVNAVLIARVNVRDDALKNLTPDPV